VLFRSHEINNPLTYVLGGASFLGELARGSVHLPAAAITAIHEIEHGVRRVRRIVADLGMFGRGERDDDRPVDIAATVGWAVRMTASQLRARARVVTRLEPTPPVLGNDTRLGQVVLNLLTNAAQAIEEGHPADHLITVSSGVEPDGAVRIEVSDTGCGIPADIVGRVFDPFFTTKPVGLGTGLGLSICHGIVSAMGGTLTVTSAPGRGSTFTVRLPATLPWPAAETPPAVAVQPRRGRILIVDDEPLIVKLLVHVIGDAHDVVAAGGGREALAIIDADRTFDLILCDLTMPDLNGIDLHERLEDAHPELLDRLVFLTGGAHTPRARAFVARADIVVIEKPVETAALLRLIAARLAPRDAGA